MGAFVGSSPRVWGQEIIIWVRVQLVRIIPTRVGTSATGHPIHPTREDHPHACGDKCVILCFVKSVKGSSPRVWGQAPCTVSAECAVRIIPTRVGTSSAVNRKVYGHWDHPHACGDKKESVKAGITFPGSSPRVWGQVRKG